MDTIGCEQEARTILSWVRNKGSEYRYGYPRVVEEKAAPEGWKFLGKGCYRSVWESPTGVAYKVGHYDYCDQQRSEAHALAAAWQKEPLDGCRLPRYSLFDLLNDSGEEEQVIAMELIKGETLFVWGRKRDGDEYIKARNLMRIIGSHYQIDDMHDENVMIDGDGTMVPIDFGL